MGQQEEHWIPALKRTQSFRIIPLILKQISLPALAAQFG